MKKSEMREKERERDLSLKKLEDLAAPKKGVLAAAAAAPENEDVIVKISVSHFSSISFPALRRKINCLSRHLSLSF